MNEPLEGHSGKVGEKGEPGCTDLDLGKEAGRLELSAHFTDGGTEAPGGTRTMGKNLEERGWDSCAWEFS